MAHTTEKTTENGINGTSKAGTQAEEVNGDGTKKQKTEVPAPVELSQEMELIVTWARGTKDQNLPWRGGGKGESEAGLVESQSVQATWPA